VIKRTNEQTNKAMAEITLILYFSKTNGLFKTIQNGI